MYSVTWSSFFEIGEIFMHLLFVWWVWYEDQDAAPAWMCAQIWRLFLYKVLMKCKRENEQGSALILTSSDRGCVPISVLAHTSIGKQSAVLTLGLQLRRSVLDLHLRKRVDVGLLAWTWVREPLDLSVSFMHIKDQSQRLVPVCVHYTGNEIKHVGVKVGSTPNRVHYISLKSHLGFSLVCPT